MPDIDYSKGSEEELLRAAQAYEKLRFDPKLDERSRAKAASEYDRIGQEFQRRSPITVTEDAPDLGPVPGMIRGSQAGNLAPGDPGPPLKVTNDVAIGEGAEATFPPIAGSGGMPPSVEQMREAEAKKQAPVALESREAQKGQQLDIGQLKEAERALSGEIGGGSGPSLGVSQSSGNVSQVERKQLPPEWYRSLERFTEGSRESAIGKTAEQAALLEIARRSAERREANARDYREGTEASALREASALANSRRRVDSAMRAYAESGPKYESVGTVLADAPFGKQVFGGLGLLLGIFMGGPTNGFVDAVNKNIERRAKIAELDSQRKGALVGMAGDQYRKLDQELGDARATRAMVRALYLQEHEEQVKEQAARIGIASSDPRLAGLFAQIEQMRMGYLEKAASVLMNQSRSETSVAPIKGTGPNTEDLMEKYVKERKDRGMNEMEGGIRLMDNGVAKMEKEGGRGYLTTAAFRLILAKPETWGNWASVFPGAKITPGEQAFLNGVALFLKSDAGKATTVPERSAMAASAARGDIEGLRQMVSNFQTRYDNEEQALVPQFGKTANLYRLRQQIYDAENPRKPWDVVGTESKPTVTEKPPRAESRER